MSTRYLTSDLIGAGVQVTVGVYPNSIRPGEGLYVKNNALVARTDANFDDDYTVYAPYGGLVAVYGTIWSDYGTALQISNPQTGTGGRLIIGESGLVESDFGIAVRISGESNVKNYGTIRGNQGLSIGDMRGGVAETHVYNYGKIFAEGGVIGSIGQAVLRNEGSIEDFHFLNEGLLSSRDGSAIGVAYDSFYFDWVNSTTGTARDFVTNNGRMVGDALLGGGDDLYDGRDGTIKGTISGGSGNDTIRGGAGAERIDGGSGADNLYGGGGADLFIFRSADSLVSSAQRDTIYDFSQSQGDRMDLSLIDANPNVAGDQAFKFIGTNGFHKVAGELRYQKSNGDTYVYADWNGDGKADLAIRIDPELSLKSSDFLL